MQQYWQGCIQKFCQGGGPNLGYEKKEGAEAHVFKGGQNDTRRPIAPLNTALIGCYETSLM